MEKTKQNKHRGIVTPSSARKEGGEVPEKATEEERNKKIKYLTKPKHPKEVVNHIETALIVQQ